MRILVTGASGFVGRSLWPALRAEGHAPRLFVRDLERLKPLPPGEAPETAVGDLARPETLAPALRGMDAVVHAAALMSDKEHLPWDEFHAQNVLGTRNLLDACRKAGTPLFVHIGTVMVTGPSNGKPLDEDAPFRPGASRYMRSKALAEEEVRSSGLPWIVLRLPPLYGPGMRYGWPEVLRRIQGGSFRVIGCARARLHLTQIDDVTAGIVAALRRGSALSGRVYNLAGPEPVPLSEAFALLAGELGAPPPGRVPYAAALAAAHALRFVPDALKPEALKLLLPYRVRYFIEDYVYDISRARRDFGYDPKIRPSEGLRALAARFLEESAARHGRRVT